MSVRRRAGLLLGVVALGSACRFEKRPDLAAQQPAAGTQYSASTPSGGPLEDTVRATLAAVSDAFRVGDVTRVAQLTTRDAVLIDQEDEVRWTRADAAAQLPRPLLGGTDGLGWTLAGSTFSMLSQDAALLSLDFQASVAGENVPWTAVESWVVARTEVGWRLRYLHRSRGLGRSEARP